MRQAKDRVTPLQLQELIVRAIPPTKAAIAAGLSWWLAVLSFGSHQPYFASLAAILSLQVTVYETLAFGAQRIVGVVIGIALSLALVHFLQASAVAVAILVFLGMAVSSLLGFRARAASQVGVSGLLVLALGGKPEYAAARLMETVLGALVGVLVQALLWPPDPTPSALKAVAALGRAIAKELRGLGRGRVAAQAGKALVLAREAAEAQAAVSLARQSLRLNPLRRGRAADARRLEIAFSALERVAIEVRGMARSLRDADAADLGRFAAVPIDLAQEAVAAFVGQVEHPGSDSALRLRRALRELARANGELLPQLAGMAESGALREAGALMSDLGRMEQDIAKASRALEHRRPPRPAPAG